MKAKWIVVSGAALVLIVALFVVGDLVRRSTSSTTTTTTTTSSPVTSTTQAMTNSAVWPTAGTDQSLVDLGPVDMARRFGTEYLGMTSVVASPFRQGDSRSGEVVLRTGPSGPETTVLMRQLGPTGRWSVIGAVTATIDITAPSALERITSPVVIRGRSTAFEGVITLQVRGDGSAAPLASTQVLGGSMGVMGDFHAALTFDSSRAGGAIVGFVRSPKDGSVMAASVLRVLFP